MDATGARAIDLLTQAGVRLAPGLSETELADVEARFGFRISPVHRALLSRALPLDSGADSRWPDWRSGAPDDLNRRLRWPAEGAAGDVAHGFWLDAWGPRPLDDAAAERIARRHLDALPPVIPIYSHRYLPSAPCTDDPPVLSIWQTDVIYYGDNLLDYLAHEFGVGRRHPQELTPERRVPFWSDVVDSWEQS